MAADDLAAILGVWRNRIADLRRTIAQGRLIMATMESALNTDLPAPVRAIVSRYLNAYPLALPNRTDINERALNTNAPELPVAASAARIAASEAYWFAAKENIQTHGGMGFTWELDCHLYYRRAKNLGLALGHRVNVWEQIAEMARRGIAGMDEAFLPRNVLRLISDACCERRPQSAFNSSL